MAKQVNIRKLVDGPKYAYFLVYFKGDGQPGEIVNQTIIDPKLDLTPSMGVGQRLALVKVWYGLAGIDIKLSFDDSGNTDDSPVWVIPAGALSGHVNFSEFGGILDKTGIDASGKLLMTTSGLTSTADQGSLIIKVSKAPAPYTPP